MITIQTEEYILLDNARFTTLIIDPTVAYTEDRPVHCQYCGHLLFKMNRKFAVISDGAEPYESEVPLNVFRFTRMCGPCRHYFICYLSTKSPDL